MKPFFEGYAFTYIFGTCMGFEFRAIYNFFTFGVGSTFGIYILGLNIGSLQLLRLKFWALYAGSYFWLLRF